MATDLGFADLQRRCPTVAVFAQFGTQILVECSSDRLQAGQVRAEEMASSLEVSGDRGGSERRPQHCSTRPSGI